MTEILLLPLMLYAACGLALSLAVHVLSFFDIPLGARPLFFALHIGIFPLWIPVVLILMLRSRGMQRSYWGGGFKNINAAMAGAPAWMKYMTLGFLIYAFVNFALFMLVTAGSSKHAGPAADPPWRGFSGHWMAFYSAGLTILTAAYNTGLSNLQRRCRNGHVVGLDDNFCPTCGVAIDKRPTIQ